MKREGNLYILSGPSGAGKGTLLKLLLERQERAQFSVSATTRSPRPMEREGVDYYFLSQNEFQSLIERDAFIEWAKVHNHYYGTLKTEVKKLQKIGQDVILDIDTQGALQIREKGIHAIFIFLAPPSKEELRRRLEARGTEDERSLSLRLKNAQREMERISFYDYLVINDQLEEALMRLQSILVAEDCRILRHKEGDTWPIR